MNDYDQYSFTDEQPEDGKQLWAVEITYKVSSIVVYGTEEEVSRDYPVSKIEPLGQAWRTT